MLDTLIFIGLVVMIIAGLCGAWDEYHEPYWREKYYVTRIDRFGHKWYRRERPCRKEITK